jgi:hypothetical protein
MNEFFMMLLENREAILLGTDGLLVILALIAIQRTNSTKRKIERIAGEVEKYIAAVLEEENGNCEEPGRKPDPVLPGEEEQNRLISAVLQEIFP